MQNVTITEQEYADLKRSAAALEWLQQRGVCWRGADNLVNGWRIGHTTEWHYSIAGDVRDLIERHQKMLRA